MATEKEAREPISSASDEGWNTYLNKLARPEGPLVAQHVQLIRGFWHKLRVSIHDAFPVPQAGPTEDHGLLMLWDRERHHLEVEIYEDGTYDWFYRDRETESYLGDEGLALEVRPPELVDRLRHFCN